MIEKIKVTRCKCTLCNATWIEGTKEVIICPFCKNGKGKIWSD
jgi:hypothetical protein